MHVLLLLIMVLLAGETLGQVAESYVITDITGWTSNQMAALPWFAHWVPLVPTGAPAQFSPAARNGAGTVVGEMPGGYPVPSRGVVVEADRLTYIPAWGGHNWSYWSCDADDCHFFWGRVEHSPAYDVNALGQVVGHATVETPSSNSALDAVDHAYLFDSANGWKTDLTPEGTGYARALRLNDAGVVIGSFNSGGRYVAFRREPDGTMREFVQAGATVEPMVLNNNGWVAGIHTTYTVSNRIVVPWVAVHTTLMTPLPLPTQSRPDTCTFTDFNHHGLLVGWANKRATPWETTAVRWFMRSGSWQAEDLNEVVDAGDYILDRVLAANDAGHLLVAAHLDQPSQTPRTLLLTPVSFPPPTALTLMPGNLSPTSAVLRATVNGCNLETSVLWDWGEGQTSNTLAATPTVVTGTAPVLVSGLLTGLRPHTTYRCRVRAQNAQGLTEGGEVVFTTPYDFATWAAEHFGRDATNPAVAGPLADADADGWSNVAEYMLGLDPSGVDVEVLQVRVVSGRLIVSLPLAPDRAGFTVIVEAATHLAGPWQSGPGAAVVAELTRHGALETRTVRTDFPGSPPQQFLRLRVVEVR